MQKTCPQCGKHYEKSTFICPGDGQLLLNPSDSDAHPPALTALVGKRMNDYEILSLLAVGSKAAIFVVKDSSKKVVVLKMLLPELSENRSSFARFQQEARIALDVDHANSVKVHSFGLSPDGQPYLVMELLQGIALKQLLEESGPLSVDTFKAVFKQLCDVLATIHKLGYVHRDLKPEHVMVCKQEDGKSVVKLIDFGCSKNLEKGQRLTVSGVLLGSADYMCPEQCTGGEVDARCDIYSLGCMMYRSLTGKKPFDGKIVEVMQKHISETPESFKTANPDVSVPEALEKVVFKAMEKDSARRPQSMDELWNEIERALRTS
jgi:serine/threonine-protein kinase